MDVLMALPVDDRHTWGETAAPWQITDAAAIFDQSGPRNHLRTLPRGGRKSTDAAASGVSLHLTQAPLGATSYVIASDADQGGLLLDTVRGFLLRRPALKQVMRVESRRVLFLRDREVRSTITVLPADEPGAFGLRPFLTICDELAVWPSTPAAQGIWAAIVSAQPKVPGSRLVVVTSAGSPSHWSYRVVEHARSSPAWRCSEIEGPLDWVSEEELAEQRALLLPAVFERLHLNRWSEGPEKLTTRDDVLACVDHPPEPLEPVRGRSYVVTLDAGLTDDRCVAVVAHADDGRVIVDRLQVWQGSRQAPVQLDTVEQWVRMAHRAYFRPPVLADPWQTQSMLQRLNASGVRARPFVFSSTSVGRLAASLYRALRDRRLGLPDDPDLIDELCTVRLRETAPGQFRLDHDSGRHDDRAVAIAMAVNHFDDKPAGAATVSNPAGRRMPPSQIVRPGADIGFAGASGRGGETGRRIARRSQQARIMKMQGLRGAPPGSFKPPQEGPRS